MPPPVDGTIPFDVMLLFVTSSVELPVLGWNRIPVAGLWTAIPEMFTLCRLSMEPCWKTIPFCGTPLTVMLRRLTTMFAPLMVIGMPKTATAAVPAQSMVIDLLISKPASKVPVSRQRIWPPAPVFKKAPVNDRHGESCLHEFALSPRRETNVTNSSASAGLSYKLIIATVRMGRMAWRYIANLPGCEKAQP